MIEGKQAAFNFVKFRVPDFSYTESDNPEITLKFEPSGKYYLQKGEFELNLVFKGYSVTKPDHQIIHVSSIGYFKFSPGLPFTEIPPYFYKNSIAILFPYLRSFISTLTLQANTGLIILKLMNLTNLEETFKTQTVCIEEGEAEQPVV